MTRVYLVRHAQPDPSYEGNSNRPLSPEGKQDSEAVTEFLKSRKIDAFYCSPYRRSLDTISGAADVSGSDIITDERLRERERGRNGNTLDLHQKRWSDHDFHEEGGESLNMVQERNIDVLSEILKTNRDKSVVIGTHGMGLSAILNYYDSNFALEDFLRIINWMPYIIELDFEGDQLVSKTEHFHIEK